MKLINFSITNFRSITAAKKIPIQQTTILIGQNNEGKSNILKSLSIAMNILQEHAMDERRPRLMRRTTRFRRDEGHYWWERDFPITLQARKGAKKSIFRLEFELTSDEIEVFKSEIKSNLNGTLPLSISIGEDNRPTIQVPKRGRGSKTLNSKSSRIASFVAGRISYNLIPAIRTDQEAISIINEMVSRELRVLEKESAYIAALKKIDEMRKPVLKQLAERIKKPLSEFLPTISDVKIEMLEDTQRYVSRYEFNVIVDDGTPTSIEFKGDGVKSLATLGLLKNRFVTSDASIIAIEEPESHLHPSAIHQLVDIISSLSTDNQVIVSTHNPLFVERTQIRSNIIINLGAAAPAKSIDQIRKLLGIRASDNLTNANFAVVVEGGEDMRALSALMPVLSPNLTRALKNNLIVIYPLYGASNLSYQLSQLKNTLCDYHVLLDNDDAGRTAYEKAFNANLLGPKNCTFVICPGMDNSELEDCIDAKIYESSVKRDFNVLLNVSTFKTNEKWSVRMRKTFQKQGKMWNDRVEKEVKDLIASSVENNPQDALNKHKGSAIHAFVRDIERIQVPS
jgi:predicted ATPase